MKEKPDNNQCVLLILIILSTLNEVKQYRAIPFEYLTQILIDFNFFSMMNDLLEFKVMCAGYGRLRPNQTDCTSSVNK